MTSEQERQVDGGPGAGVGAQLEALWREILGIDEIRPDDSFIALGGESLAGVLCINRIKAVFGVLIPLGVLLAEETTIAALATQIEASVSSVGTAAAT